MIAVHGENIEGVNLHLMLVLAAVQRVKIGNAVDAEHHGFAIDDELLLPILQRGLSDPG